MPATHSKLTSWSTGSSDAFETWLQQTKGFWLRKDVWEIIQDGDPAETGKKTTKTIDQVAVQRMAVVMLNADVEEPMYDQNGHPVMDWEDRTITPRARF